MGSSFPVAAEATPDVATAVLVARDLHKAYRISRPPRPVLRGASLSVAPGEFVAIMGSSGSGKSTLLHVLGGLEPPDSGSVTIEGTDVYGLGDGPRSAFRRDRIGFVFQFFNLLPSLTAAENVALPLRLRGQSWLRPRARRQTNALTMQRVSALMELLGLHGLQGHGPEEISGGEQQRVAIARALVAAPALLLADEPTGNLDSAASQEVMSLLRRLCRSERHTTIVATHDVQVAAYADRVVVMRDGALIGALVVPRPTDVTAPADPGPIAERVTALLA